MGQIDVSDLILDPDFLDPVVLIHRQAFVDELGQNRLKETPFNTYGSVQSVSGKTLQRIPESLRVADIRSFWVKGKIIADGNCQYPDIISFHGQRFAVQMVFDWSNWGEGFCEGTCVREKITQ